MRNVPITQWVYCGGLSPLFTTEPLQTATTSRAPQAADEPFPKSAPWCLHISPVSLVEHSSSRLL